MFDSKYSKVLTIILIIVIVAIIALLGFLAFDYIQKYSSEKQASSFVEDFEGNITTGEQDVVENEVTSNIVLDNTNEVPISSGSTASGK